MRASDEVDLEDLPEELSVEGERATLKITTYDETGTTEGGQSGEDGREKRSLVPG